MADEPSPDDMTTVPCVVCDTLFAQDADPHYVLLDQPVPAAVCPGCAEKISEGFLDTFNG
jgi:hypothetical protein